MNKIEQLRNEHKQVLFPPECRGEEINGVDLVMLDADISGCISSFLKSKGRLDPKRIEILEKCQKDLNKLASKMECKSKDYYDNLKELVDFVLMETNKK